jgi:hypothetical protein
MPRTKKTTEPIVDPTDVQAVDTTATSEAFDHVDIYDGEQFIRQYSQLVHGDNFQELADACIAGHPNFRKV